MNPINPDNNPYLTTPRLHQSIELPSGGIARIFRFNSGRYAVAVTESVNRSPTRYGSYTTIISENSHRDRENFRKHAPVEDHELLFATFDWIDMMNLL